MRRQPTLTRTWRVSLNPRAHYNLSCGKDNRFSRCRQLHPDDVVCVVVVVIGVVLRWDPRPRKAMPRHLPPRNFPHVHVASPCSDSPAYTRLRYRYTCVGTPGYTCALRWKRAGMIRSRRWRRRCRNMYAHSSTVSAESLGSAHEHSQEIKSSVRCGICYDFCHVSI